MSDLSLGMLGPGLRPRRVGSSRKKPPIQMRFESRQASQGLMDLSALFFNALSFNQWGLAAACAGYSAYRRMTVAIWQSRCLSPACVRRRETGPMTAGIWLTVWAGRTASPGAGVSVLPWRVFQKVGAPTSISLPCVDYSTWCVACPEKSPARETDGDGAA